MTDTHDFLKLMFADVREGVFELTYIHPDKQADRYTHTFWVEFPLDLNTDFGQVHEWNRKGYGVYFGCAVRKTRKPKGQRGTKTDALYITALWCDIDNVPAQEGAMQLLELATIGEPVERPPLDPSVIVASGNGVHGYWPLTEPLLAFAERIERAVRVAASERRSSSIEHRDLLAHPELEPWLGVPAWRWRRRRLRAGA